MKIFSYLLIFPLLLAACESKNVIVVPAQTANVNQTPISLLTPTFTITPLASPTLSLTPSSTPIPCKVNGKSFDYEWCPENVLINFNVSPGDGGGDLTIPPPPNLILYSDGRMFVVHSEKKNDRYFTQILYKQLDRQGICQNLNTIEKMKYFDYDPSEYQFIGGDPIVEGAWGSMFLEINAWNTHEADYYELGFFLQDEDSGEFPEEWLATPLPERTGWPIVDERLRDVYYFMSLYPLSGFSVYVPEKLGVWLLPLEERYLDNYSYYGDPEEWISDNVSLNILAEKIDVNGKLDDPFVILTGHEAEEAYKKLDYSLNPFLFSEKSGDKIKYFLVASRPILPYESLENIFYSVIPDPSEPKPSNPLGCNIADGTLLIPTP